MTTYNGNDIFKPFNAGLYGIDFDDSDRSMQWQESKDSILAAFRYDYEQKIITALALAGIKYLGLTYYSPREYNFSNDSIDLQCEITDKGLLLAAIEKHKPAIEAAMKANKSYDGYMALTSDTWDEITDTTKAPDILVIQAILSDIDFADFDIFEHIEYAYACETCGLIHEDIEYFDSEDQRKVASCIAATVQKVIDDKRDSDNLKMPL